MGTFHQNKGELHGITVVVETTGDELWVGRCDTVDGRGVVLLDADVHRGTDDAGREEYLRKASAFGVWAKVPHVVVPHDRVASVRRLADLEG